MDVAWGRGVEVSRVGTVEAPAWSVSKEVAAVAAKGPVPGAFLEAFSGRGWSVCFPDDEATCSRCQRSRQLRKEWSLIG
ncbi:putative transcriptional regulatory protein [Fusarium oxysporum f. sp. albedinis]|nr:putative transcriptional regulatory protein [Fusarium oxysporum f. sp. albedinis]